MAQRTRTEIEAAADGGWHVVCLGVSGWLISTFTFADREAAERHAAEWKQAVVCAGRRAAEDTRYRMEYIRQTTRTRNAR